MPQLELISHDLCPFVQRVAIALTEKNVPFARTNIDLDHRPQWFNEISPAGKVPLLRVGADVIFESAVIIEYLEETQPHPLHPSSPLARAWHRGWIEFASSLLMDNYAFLMAREAAPMTAARNAIRAKIERLEAALAAGPYFDGAAFSLVDAAFAPFFAYWDAFERIDDFGVFAQAPRIQAWRRSLAARPSVRSVIGNAFDERLLLALPKLNSRLSLFASRRGAVADPVSGAQA